MTDYGAMRRQVNAKRRADVLTDEVIAPTAYAVTIWNERTVPMGDVESRLVSPVAALD
ncbi:MAG: hypothetical protein JWR22_3401 [Herminiimonas sp.]|nr:hypothetical protein [Herminiimonas sp.]